MRIIKAWREWRKNVGNFKTDILAVFLAVQDKRVPLYVKAFALLVVGYAFSPIDLVPDFIPILGQIDDLVLLPAGMYLIKRMLPEPLLDEYREKAATLKHDIKRKSWIAAIIIIAIWVAIIMAVYYALNRR